ncbi:MAG: S8 family peptidase [Candidatus Riflebacteria bacterium]|nr:S8 family peptidase [Candidatus Riflebacteria bacterium]
MSAPRKLKHLQVRSPPSTEPYRPHARTLHLPPYAGPPDRARHSATLLEALAKAERESRGDRDRVDIVVQGAEHGLYVEFESPAGVELKLDSLEDKRKGIELVAVRIVEARDQESVQRATVFVPDGQLKHFVKRFEEYATQRTQGGEPRHKALVDRIAALHRATLRALWTDDPAAYPADHETIWWEVWLRRHDGHELGRLMDFAGKVGLAVGARRLVLGDRTVVLVKGAAANLAKSLDVLSDLAEVRKAKETASFFMDMSAAEQAEWVADLKQRTVSPAAGAPAVCILDTGVNREHVLLREIIAPEDAQAVDASWGAADGMGGSPDAGHGTEMAGLAVYGDLCPLLQSTEEVRLRHRLESVKILPPRGQTPPDLYGALIAQAVSLPEVNNARRLRVFSMAVTAADQRDQGQPTSWSASLDALAAGRVFTSYGQSLEYLDQADPATSRLFVLSAGNVDANKLQREHLDLSDLEAVHDPAQAWNVLTVGAYTEKELITDPTLAGWSPVAVAGELSPWSTTSVTFRDSWPIKPEVVFEGGNTAHDGKNIDFPIVDLSLVSTGHQKPLAVSYATSAAAAQGARMAAIIRAEYPEYWPETVRALIVHSAAWTQTMKGHLPPGRRRRTPRALVRRYGFGVPDLDRALRSASDSLTLVVQSSLRPFARGSMHEMHVHELPWPREVLVGLGEAQVRLRVTLSYFVEPSPGRRGWKRRHRYASHGLRFEVKSPSESIDEFRKRLNQKALEDDEERPRSGKGSEGWDLGEQTRNKGSIHSDTWSGTAADLADRGVIGVFPVSGWWKESPPRGRNAPVARYALVLGIETDAVDVDIWTPVALQVGIPVEGLVVRSQ